MKHILPSGRHGRLAALGLTLAVPTALWLGVVSPLMQWHKDRAETLVQREVLAQRMQILIAALPDLRRQSITIAANGAGGSVLLEGESDAVASAFLQERLQAMFVQAGVQLDSVETLPGEDAGAYRRIRLHVAFNATWPGLMALLKDMQLATPTLLVDELTIQPALHRISTAPGTFDVSCGIFAFRSGATRVAVR
jgi:general secretion pathway protein M